MKQFSHMEQVQLSYRAPLWPDSLFGHLVATAVPGVEEWIDGSYRRTLRLPGGAGIVALTPGTGHIRCRLLLTDRADRDAAVSACRRVLDLDADPITIDARLSTDPLLAPLIASAPGRRVPGAVDVSEMAVRAVLGQQVSTAAARTHAARLVTAHGEPLDDPEGGLTRLFPAPAELTGLDPSSLALPGARRTTLIGVIRALANAGPEPVRNRLAGLPGIGPWTLETIAMRALGDRDAFIATDLGVRLAARRLGLPATPAALTAHSTRWRPYRAYAVQYLWATGEHAVNRMPNGSSDTSLRRGDQVLGM